MLGGNQSFPERNHKISDHRAARTAKLDQQYPMFVLYNKSDTPKRPENLKKYYNVLNALVDGCKMLEKKVLKMLW